MPRRKAAALFDNWDLNLRSLRKHWDLFGARDPLWAILTHPERKDRRWDIGEFFETGIGEINGVLNYVDALAPGYGKRRALDFGCGVGRLSQALAEHFEEVYGVDISSAMIQHARGHNRHGDRCHYLVNEVDDLRIFPDEHFDFIYSNITLQHMPSRYSRRYIAEFLRVLAPAGALLFQLPGQARTSGSTFAGRSLRKFYYRFLWDILHPQTPYMGMYGIPKEELISWIRRHGGQVIDVVPDPAAEPEWEGFRYLVRRVARDAGPHPSGQMTTL
jgi:ubiquinone/menaquinone biosynthesis C-methylase UbiE